MNKRILNKVFIMTLLLAVTVFLGACGSENKAGDNNVSKNKEEITIFAAASLTESFDEIKPLYEGENEAVTLQLNLDSSGRLRTQIEEGVEADIFISANEKHYNILKENGFVAEGKHLLSNKVVCIVPVDNPANIESVEDLSKDCKFVTAQKEVPIGSYTLKMLDELDEKYGNNYKEKVLGNIVSEENNVKQVLSKVVLGEADAAFVYYSDVTDSNKDKLKIIDIPEDIDASASYWAALLDKSKDKENAKKLYDYLTQEEAQKIFEKNGFIRP